MKKTLILLFVVLMSVTLFVACSSSPESTPESSTVKETYAVKVVLKDLYNDDVLGIDGTYYMTGNAKTKKPEVENVEYVLYSDSTCNKATDLILRLQQVSDNEYRVIIDDYDEIYWRTKDKKIEAGASINELSVKASDTPFIDLVGDTANDYAGTIKMYAIKDVVLTINATEK